MARRQRRGLGQAFGQTWSELRRQLPTPVRVLLTLLAVALGVTAFLANIKELGGFESAADLARWAGWGGAFALTSFLLVLAVTILVLVLLGRLTPPWKSPEPPLRPHSLPKTAMIGRRHELEQLRGEVDNHRLVTVWGTAGVGKTRLCEEVLRVPGLRLPPKWYFVDLAEARTREDVASRVAQQLGSDRPGTPKVSAAAAIDEVGAMLAAAGRCLIVLDTFENVRDSARRVLASWHAAAPDVHFLVTSQRPLDIPEERLFPLAPFAVGRPPNPGAAHLAREDDDALALFCEEVKRVRGGKTLATDEERQTALEICQLVGGLPLAILAEAARLRYKSLAFVAAAVRQGPALRPAAGGAPGRYQDSEALARRTLDLLRPAERAAALELSAFPGSFGPDAPAALVAPDHLRAGGGAPRVIEVLNDVRLIHEVDWLPEIERYSFYPLMRDGCERILAEAATPAERDALEARVADYQIRVAEHWEARVDTEDSAEALDHLEAEFESLWAVCQRRLSAGDSVRAAQLYVATTGMLRTRRVIENRLKSLSDCLAGVDKAGADELAVRLRSELAIAYFDLGEIPQAARWIDDAVTRLHAAAMTGLTASQACLWQAAIRATEALRSADPRPLLEEAAASLDDAWRVYPRVGTDRRWMARLHRADASVGMRPRASTIWRASCWPRPRRPGRASC